MDNRDDTNRDLLIGLLALQNGLVEQDVLILAFRAWTRDKSRPIAELLASQGAIDANERGLLEGLAAKHLRRHGGDVEKSLAAVKVVLVITTRERVLKSLGTVAEANPTNSILQSDMAWIETLLGWQYLSAERDAEALAAFERACSARERLSKANPTSIRHIEQRLGLHRMIGSIHHRGGRSTNARASFETARVVAENAIPAIGSAPTILSELSYVYQAWADLELSTGQIAEAIAKYERMQAIVAGLIAAHPAAPLYRSRMADSIRRIGTASRLPAAPPMRSPITVDPSPNWTGWRNRLRSTSTTWPAAVR